MWKRMVLVGVLAAFGLSGCAAADTPEPKAEVEVKEASPAPAPKPTPKPTAEPKPEPEPWAGPTDGTWDYGDVGYGQTYEHRLTDYRVTVVGLPEFGPLESGEVKVTGTFNVERFQDRGYDKKIVDGVRFGFTPGAGSGSPLSETYGLYVDVSCGGEAIDVGASTTCRVSFKAPTAEMQNFCWWINGNNVAAWPGQTA